MGTWGYKFSTYTIQLALSLPLSHSLLYSFHVALGGNLNKDLGRASHTVAHKPGESIIGTKPIAHEKDTAIRK